MTNSIGHHAGINDDTAAKAITHAILDSVTTAHKGNGVRIRFRRFEKQSNQEAQTAPSTNHRCKSAEIVQRFIHGWSEAEITKLDG